MPQAAEIGNATQMRQHTRALVISHDGGNGGCMPKPNPLRLLRAPMTPVASYVVVAFAHEPGLRSTNPTGRARQKPTAMLPQACSRLDREGASKRAISHFITTPSMFGIFSIWGSFSKARIKHGFSST